MNFNFCGKNIDTSILKEEKWLKYLLITKENQINLERINSLNELSKNQVLLYVEKTFDIIKSSKLDNKYKKCLIRTLQWSEVAKCGSEKDRERWKDLGLSLSVHNEASAEIYLNENNDDLWTTKIVYVLIKTHGLLGQYIRGETNFIKNVDLLELLSTKLISKEHLYQLLLELNEAIISAVSLELWEEIKSDIILYINLICNKRIVWLNEKNIFRLQKLFPCFKDVDKLSKNEEKLYNKIFSYHDLWYPQIALKTFSRTEINTIFSIIEKVDRRKIKHISFYNLSSNLFYDYEGKRKENIYKKRIIELYLREYNENIDNKSSNKHVSITTEIKGDTLFFDVKFTPVCKSLINFCVEAERSGIMDYQKNITAIFDMFGFRKDIFDRLNNEEKYLRTMNDARNSTKLDLLNYVHGKTIVDVGSGGGVLLDMLEEKFPDKKIIGTDISTAVIENLERKIKDEKHKYIVLKHNFVEKPLDVKVDTIIFSSILHEIYSYTEFDGKKFNINSVKKALKNAYLSLEDNGVLLIRDGALTDVNKILGSVTFKTDEGVAFCKNFIKDFKGLEYLRNPETNEWENVILKENTLIADINFIREALFTFTWGIDSYSQEVLEQFGYFTLAKFEDFLKSLNLNIEFSNIFTEQGYPDHLKNKVKLNDFDWNDIPSTCFIVAKK